MVFAVRRVEADYLKPARFDDSLVVQTAVMSVTGARILLRQVVERDGEALFSAVVTLVCLGAKGQAVRLPLALSRAAGGDTCG